MAPASASQENILLRLVLTSSSAVVAEAATFPIDITKTRLQLQGELGYSFGKVKKGAFGTAIGIFKDEGISGLYRGLSPALLRHAFYTSLRIVIYEQLRTALLKGEEVQSLSVAKTALIGGTAGIIGQAVASPADLVKVRMQSDGRLVKLGHSPRYTGISDAFSKIIKNEGLFGLWRGVGPNVQRACLVNMGELACYDQAKQFVVSHGVLGDNIYAHTVAAMLSGLSATILSCPADVVKTRMMNQAIDGKDGVAAYKHSLDCLTKTVKAEGVMALWKGFFPTWTRLGPWQFVFWVSYEQLRKFSGLSSF
ncbi:hypothetical protein O6H91_15G042600 [Diphasiastrum complanatum]|uniref:Uncharacterized protein n=2 Tax=Diphasiastrum complanatum TaxID=34168 RepID=A0ACC2BHR8_DIPCM|nr:hypothetical protein O6H91_15G042600 [Diphasiastrum complanatum]KAJ7529291.1 hypothetical protein O6H91_15G042600 [Diphasiastrum complanatum]